MKLESPYINPITFSNGSTELETESYRSSNILNCQVYEENDYLQFIVYFTKEEGARIRVKFNGTPIETPHVFSNAIQESWQGTYVQGFRRLGKGYVIVRAKLSDFNLQPNDELIVSVELYNGDVSCLLTSNKIAIVTSGISKLLKYSNTYDNNICDFSLLPGLFEYRFYGLFYKTEFETEAEVFQGNTISEVVSYDVTEQYILNIGGKDMIPLEEERKIRHILGCNVKMIDGVEFELTTDVDINSQDLFRRAGRSMDIRLQKKNYTSSVLQITTGTGGTITTNRPVTYDTESFTLAIDPASLTTITVVDSASRATLNKTLINSKDIVKVDFGINQNTDANRTIDLTISDAVTTQTLTITQKYSGLTFNDAILNKNLILRNL